MKRKLLLLATIIMLLSGSCAWAQKDVTSTYIKNADLSTLDGWTQTNFSNPIKGNNTVGYAAESYAGWGSLEKTAYSLKQTITLPKGEYTLVNYSFFRQGEAYNTDNTKSLAVLKAGEKNVAIKTLGSIEAAGYANSHGEGANCLDSKMYRNTLDFTIDTDGTEIEIGIEGTFDQMRSWCIVGMFELIDKNSEATMDVPLDVTGYITNPGFEYRNMTGWTLSGDGTLGTQTNNQSFKKGLVYAEKWQQSGALTERSMQQTISGLPAGYYKLTANLGGDGTYLSLNGKTVNWSGDNDYTTGYVLGENEDLIIKAGKTAEGTANWIHFDDFRLYFCGDVNAALEAQISKLSSYETKMPLGKYNELKTAVTAYDKDYSDIDELLQAISAIETLYADADEFIKAFNVLYSSAKELIALCEKYSENSTPNSEDIKNTFDGNIATAKTDVESAQTIEALTNAIAALESARQTYVQNAYPTNDVTFDLTFMIVNAQVTSKDGWTNGRIHSGEQYTGAPDNTYLDNWDAQANNIKQEVVLPKGVYQLKAATRAGSDVTVGNIYILDQATENNYSTDIHKVGNSGNTLGNGWDWTVVDNIILEGESNTVTVGFYSETSGGKWAGADNFTLTLVSKEPDFAYTLVTGKMESAVATAQTAAETAFKNNKTVENYNALLAAIDDAQASVDAYASANKYFAKMKAVLDNTNVYTQEAYNAKYGTWLAAYNENTLETSIAATLTENSAYSAGWHSENKIDDILLSTWTVGGEAAYNYDKALYINTWSVEGDNDGTNFKVPFFEYWTGDDKSLGATTLTATVTGLEVDKKYTAKVWARVRIKNGASDPTGITFSVGNGTPVDITAGAQVGTSQFYIAEFVAVGNTDAEGNLTINFNIAADNNISWLSYKNVNYSEYHTTSNLDFSESTPIDNHICTYAKDMETNGTTYSQMQPVTSWDMAVENGDARAAGVFAYGGTPWIGGAGYPAPATNPEGVAEGNALGMVGVWSATVQYTQPVTLLPGNYVLTVPVYNTGAGKNNMAKNLIGFIAEDGTEYLASAKVYPSNTWTTETITFTLDKVTNGVLSLGYQAPNAGNGSQHHLFIDCVKIEVVTDLDLAKEELLADIKDAKATVDAKAGVGEGLFLIPTSALDTYAAAVEAAQTAHDAATTVADVEAAIATLAVATEAYAASIALPEADKDYQIIHNVSGLFMSLNGGVKIEAAATVKFEAAGDGKYYIANANGEYAYYSGTGDNKWSLNVSAGSKEAWTITAVGDGLYTIKGKNGHIGTDNLTNGSTCYGNKAGDAANSMWVIREATEVSVTMNISDAKYSTFIAPFGVTIPEGVTASKVTGETNGVLTLETVETTIPANTPVVLYSETKYNSTFTGIDFSTKDSYTDGLLTGVYTATDVQLGWYVLQNNDGKVGFYRVDTEAITKVGANRCYLTIPAGSEAKAFFFGGEATGINAIEALQNGDAEIYTINGTRVNTLQKGVNIVKMSNGKTQKVLVK